MYTKPPAPKPTIADVAERAGVSTATVSRVLNGTAKVSQSTTHRVQAAIRELNYKPRAAAKGLASGKAHALGLITPLITSEFFTPVLNGIEAYANRSGFDLLIHCTRGELSEGPGFHRPLGPNNVDGLLVFSGSLNNEELGYLSENDFPVVLLLQSPPQGLKISSVVFENEKSAQQLTKHLIEIHGYRRIAYIQGKEGQEDSVWRKKGYREALQQHGIAVDPNLILRAGIDAEEVRSAVEYLADLDEGVDAIFAFDDLLAIKVISFLQEKGQRVPEDIAVAGFDDLNLYRPIDPPLTTVHAPIEMAGEEAAKQLIRLINRDCSHGVIQLPTELVIRRSCGCA